MQFLHRFSLVYSQNIKLMRDVTVQWQVSVEFIINHKNIIEHYNYYVYACVEKQNWHWCYFKVNAKESLATCQIEHQLTVNKRINIK